MWWVGNKKIAGRQWLCYCLAGAVAKQEQQQNNGCMFFFTPPFSKYEICHRQNVSFSYLRM
jgi:hypothetical protein